MINYIRREEKNPILGAWTLSKRLSSKSTTEFSNYLGSSKTNSSKVFETMGISVRSNVFNVGRSQSLKKKKCKWGNSGRISELLREKWIAFVQPLIPSIFFEKWIQHILCHVIAGVASCFHAERPLSVDVTWSRWNERKACFSLVRAWWEREKEKGGNKKVERKRWSWSQPATAELVKVINRVFPPVS